MKQKSDLIFEISEPPNFIRIEPLYMTSENAEDDWDKNWIKTQITVQARAFVGNFHTELTTTDFELLKREIRCLKKNLSGSAKFEPLEGQIVLHIKGDDLGHFRVACTLTDNVAFGATLSFYIYFDQTELDRLHNELDRITKTFPIKGKMGIQNE